MTGIQTTAQSPGVDALITSQLNQQKSNTGRDNVALSTLSGGDSVNVGLDGVYKSLTILGDKIVSKLDELLAEQVPGGIASLKPEDHTSEATAQRIVDGTTALLGVYAKQNPDLEGEELIDSFMKEIRGGVEQGYNEAAAILGDLGAFQFDGVQSGIEETMSLVEEKLVAFEEDYRKQNGLPSKNPVDENPTANNNEIVSTIQ